ncbi:MAG TPA: CHAT domain-containing protein [Pyrinomonadaceae bacterium]|nr:CHAT domain-containing protein [Pyrinomonadaceae bacterium]
MPEAARARQAAAAANDNAFTLEERQAALSQLQEAVRLFLSAGKTLEAARALNRVGRLQLVLNDPQAAIKTHNDALDLLKQTARDPTEVDNLNALAAAYMRLQNQKDAKRALRRALSISKKSGYTTGKAEALLGLSDVQNYLNHLRALKTAQKALRLWQAVKNKPGIARTYSQIGECYLAQNMVSEASQNYEAALQLWRDLNDRPAQAGALIGLGFVEYRKGQWADDISYLTRAQGLIDEKAEPTRMGQIAGGLAEAFNESGMPDQGLFHSQRMLGYFRQTKDSIYIGYAYWMIGCSYYLLRQYDEAVGQFNLALAEGGRDGLLAAQVNEYLGRAYVATGEYAGAFPHLQSALDVYVSTTNPKEEAQVRALMGQIYQQQGQLARARQSYEQALGIFTKLSDRVNQAAVYFAVGRLELKNNNYDMAENYLRHSIDVTENLRRVSTSRDLTTAFSATVHDRYESYVECLMHKHRAQPAQSFNVKAFEMSEQGRGRALAELLRSTQTNLAPGLDPQLAQREKSLRQSLRVKEDYRVTLLSKEYKQKELVALNAEIAKLETEYKEVNETIRIQYPAYEQMNQPTAWTLRQIQKQVIVDDQTVLLEYSLGVEKSYVWAVTNTKVTSYELPAQAQITEAAQRVYQLLKDRPGPNSTDALMNAAQYLGGLVLSPVASELNKARIIVAADGALNYIPFQILSASPGEPLVAGHEVVNEPSASILGQLRQEAASRQTPAKVLAAFGDPVFASNYAQRKETDAGRQVASAQTNEDEQWRHAERDIETGGDSFNPAGLQPLFYSKRELANLHEVAGGETFLATGFDATRERLASADLTKYAILHFATHGILDPKRPENSGLFLSMVDRDGQAQNGFVGLADIYRLHAPVNLVVLSACRTGLGKDVRGEGLVGLTRGFMYAGASSVVASLWKVDDEATAELMKRFYTNMLQRGMTPAEALRAAQNSIRQEPQWSAPYYWAAFTLQGDYREVIKATPTAGRARSLKVIVAVALVFLLAGAAWLYRRHRGMRTA